ncbi:hypothetical protein EVG20_g1487 [Dentipellis fragilis]|uniref:RRM domain-containing protein n=1 Tax=Dentipellis fragilis TaxID=205917 RepID=A0A4Y9ZCE9_9AGAM|nr:hypothetical protein EVG20_g1487 [Dentipellis fragilis]
MSSEYHPYSVSSLPPTACVPFPTLAIPETRLPYSLQHPFETHPLPNPRLHRRHRAHAPPRLHRAQAPPAHQRTVCVSNLPANISKSDLRALFSKFGLVRNIESSGGGSVSADIEYEHAASAGNALRAAAEEPLVLAGVELIVFRPVRAAFVSPKLPDDRLATNWRRKHPEEARAEVMVFIVRGFGPLMDPYDVVNKFMAYGRPYGVDMHPMRSFVQVALPGNDALADEIIAEYERDPLVIRGRIVDVKKGIYWGQEWIDLSPNRNQAPRNKKRNPESIDVAYETVVPETQPEVLQMMAEERQLRRAERWERGRKSKKEETMDDGVGEAEKMRLEWLAQLDAKLTEGKKAGLQQEQEQAEILQEKESQTAKT